MCHRLLCSLLPCLYFAVQIYVMPVIAAKPTCTRTSVEGNNFLIIDAKHDFPVSPVQHVATLLCHPQAGWP